MRRWLLRIAIVLVCLLLVAVVSVQAVLWSDWPRRIVLRELQAESGLVIEARSLQAGWRGRTILSDVTVRLPLANQPLAVLPSLQVSHTPLLPMMALRRVDIHALSAEQAQLHVVQNHSGDWNLLELVRTVQEQQEKHEVRTRREQPLPRISLQNAAVSLVARSGEKIDLPPLQFHGEPEGSLVWQFRCLLPTLLSLDGRLRTGSTWAHEVSFEVQDADQLARVLSGDWIAALEERAAAAGAGDHMPAAEEWPISGAGAWRGQIENGRLNGRLTLHHARVGETVLDGLVAVTFGEGELSFSQPNFTLRNPDWPLDKWRITAGTAQWKQHVFEVDQLNVSAEAISASVAGNYDAAARRGSLHARWSGRLNDVDLVHRGAAHVALDLPAVGQKRIIATAESTGSAPLGQWNAEFEAQASGPTWTNLNAALNWQKLAWRAREQTVDLGGLSIQASSDWPVLRLTRIHLPRGEATGSGEFNLHTRQWTLQTMMKQWPVPIEGTALDLEPMDLQLRASGDADRMEVANFSFTADPLQFRMSGTYARLDPQPLRAQCTIDVRLPAHGHSTMDNGLAATVKPGDGNPGTRSVDVVHPASAMPVAPAASVPAGAMQLRASVTGNVQPLDLALQGELSGTHVPVAAGTIDAFTMPVQGIVQRHLVSFESHDVQLLGGTLNLRGTFDPQSRMSDLHIDAMDLSLQQVAPLVASPVEIAGVVGGQAQAQLSPLNPRDITLTGSWQAKNVTTPAGDVSLAQGNLDLRSGLLYLDRVEMLHADGEARLAGNAVFNSHVNHISGTLAGERWPLRLDEPDVLLLASGEAEFACDLNTREVTGRAALTSAVTLEGRDLGTARATLTSSNRVLNVTGFEASLLNGSVRGSGTIPLDREGAAGWTNSRASLAWENLDLSLLAGFVPALRSLEGISAGTATLEPAPSERALAPLRLHMSMRAKDARTRSITIGDADLTAYAGPGLLSIERANARVADGEIDLWGRVSRHGEERYAHLHANYRGLDLNQIVQWHQPREDEVPGRVHGSATLGGYLREPYRLFGQAEATLEESDLVNVRAFSLIHSALNLSVGQVEPTGVGSATVRLEGDALELSRLEYFNRGADIVASIRIEDIWMGLESPISGVAVGGMRPLKNIHLPFFRDLDRALKAVQTGAASVRINGTLGEPNERLVPFAEISGAVRRILGGSR